ncbi:hypothetical protein [Vibrio antiquarius]|uniref:hypothetical protein n=1 Tax=Vibrio antiquarius (strain Ex25) TaxID=150340 RepID=UPI001D90AFF8|nr:hypothetical protein [Vibrio antiquarius]EGQ9298918.1 hypothetical protein [Vibrio parahaemolyticus]EGR0686956.1 hypothetical protein [Vibrio parahaemolyticus]MCR9845873.1 hypothetical protein [Vibrio antiquarius]MCR9911350.1 hypothetical protein [Vibrio antiquarius]
MANTTDLMITCASEDKVIQSISIATGIEFINVTDGTSSVGDKSSSFFNSYAAVNRCIETDKLSLVISTFSETSFSYPEYAVLFVDDDIREDLNGVYRPQNI